MRWKRLAAAVLAAAIIISGAVGLKFLRRKVKADWNPFAESAQYLANAERGFYNIVGVLVSDETELDDAALAAFAQEREGVTLELLQIHIGAYASRPVSEAGLAQIRRVLEAYRDRQVRLIVRVLYDWDGKGMESDPSSQDIVLTHMEQLGSLFEEFCGQIYLIQGVFVGSWGEMHGSRYLAQDSYLALIRKMHEAMPASAFLAVRTPAYWRTAAGTDDPLEALAQADGLARRLSLYNDGMLGSDTDCGTYGSAARAEAGPGESWARADELAFQSALNLYVPNGGEVILDNPLNDFDAADEALRTMRVSYLNEGYDPAVLQKWKETVCSEPGSVYDGMSGYDYIERHLGYRYVVRSAQVQKAVWAWNEPELAVTVENVGYANRYTGCTVELLVTRRDTGETASLPVETDVRSWNPGGTVTLKAPLALEAGAEYEIALRVSSAEDGAPVWFANEGISGQDGSVLLGTVRVENGLARG